MYIELDNREKGIYRELIDQCWVAGSISSDPTVLARSVHEPVDYFAGLWVKLRPKFHSIQGGERLISPRLEQDRRRLMHTAKFTEKRAKKAASVRWAKHNAEKELHASSIAQASPKHAFKQCQTHTQKEEYSPLQDSPNLENSNSLITGPPADKPPAARPRDQASDYFASKCEELTGVPYATESADFVMLSRLRKVFKTPARELPPGWEEATQNYLASPLGQYSLADLANPKRYAVFKNSPIDQYNRPINHANRSNGHGSKSKTERTVEGAQRLSLALDRQAGDSDERGDQRSNPARVLPKAEDFKA